MSVSKELRIASGLSRQQVIEMLRESLDFPIGFDGKDALWTQDLLLHVGGDYEIPCYLTIDNFGFNPTVDLSFHVAHAEGGDWERGQRQMARICMAFLENDTGNAVFLINGESILFTRLDGKLRFNDNGVNNQRYLEIFLSEVTLPFTREEIKHEWV